MRHHAWRLAALALVMTTAFGCGNSSRPHLNNNPNDLGMPDSPTISDSPMPGQPNGYAPSGSKHTDSAQVGAVDSTTKENYQ